MTTEPKIKNNIIYVEPNYIKSMEEYGSNGLTTTEFAPPLEDYSIFVNLEVEIRGRNVQSSKTSGLNTLVMSWVSTTSGSSTVNFMQGTKIPVGENGASIYSLTTNYTDISINNLRTGEPSTEMFGIKSIDIAYNNYMVPEVTIEFVDVRGVSLFGQKEEFETAKNIDAAINSGNKADVANTFFQCFFTFPYPKFRLMVKGFYGQPVSYELTCSDFRAKFDSSTGNFACTAKFIGYHFSFLNDVMINGILAAPYSDYIGDDYWSKKQFKLKGLDGTEIDMPKVGELLGIMKQIKNEVERISDSSPEAQEKAILDSKNDRFSSIINVYAEYTEAIKTAFKEKSSGSSINLFFEEVDTQGYMKGAIMLSPSLNEDDFEDYTNNSSVEGKWEALSDALEEYNKEFPDKKLPIPNRFFASSPMPIIKPMSNDATKATLDLEHLSTVTRAFGNHNCREKYPRLFENLKNTVESAEAERFDYVSVNDNINPYLLWAKGYYFYDNDLSETIEKYRKENGENITEIEEKIDALKDSLLEENLHFKPNVENLTRIIMAHFETFAYMIFKTAKEISSESPSRTISSLGISDIKDVSDVINREADPNVIVPPFPKVVKEVKREKSTIREEAWVGDYSGDFREKDLVHGLINGVSLFAPKAAAYSGKETGASGMLGSEGSTVAVMRFPLSPLDMVATKQPYPSGGFDANEISSIFGLVGIRAMQILGMNNFSGWDSNPNVLGKAEAHNFLSTHKLSSEMKQKLSTIDGNEIVNMLNDSGYNTVTKPGNGSAPWPWNPRNNNDGAMISSNGELKIFNAPGKGFTVPYQNLSWGEFNTDILATDNCTKAIKDESYFNTFRYQDQIKKNLFTFDTNPERFAKIAENQLTDLDGISFYQEKFLDECKYKKEKYISNDLIEDNAKKVIAYVIKDAKNMIPSTKSCMLPARPDLAPEGYSFGGGYNLNNFHDEELSGWKDKDGNEVKRMGKDGYDKYLEAINTNDFTFTEFPGVNGDLSVFLNDGNPINSIFGEQLYYLQTCDESKAVLFLASLGYAFDYKKIINGFIADNKKTMAVMPLPALMFIGGLLWLERNKDKMKGYNYAHYNEEVSNLLNNLKDDVLDRFVKIFLNWVSKNVEGDSVLPSFKGIKSGLELTLTAPGRNYDFFFKNIGEIEDDTTILAKIGVLIPYGLTTLSIINSVTKGKIGGDGWVSNFNKGYKTVFDFLRKELSNSFFENYIVIDEDVYHDKNNLVSGIRLGIRDGGPSAIKATSFALSTCVFSKNTKYFHRNSPNNVTVSTDKLRLFMDGFLSVVKGDETTNEEVNNSQISKAVEPKTKSNTDIKIGIYRYCKMIYDKWIAGLDEEEFEKNWTVESFFDDDDKYFHFIDAYYNDSTYIPLNIDDFCDKLVSSYQNDQYSLLSFLSSIYAKNKFTFLCIQNFMDLSKKENMASMFDTVPYTSHWNVKTHPNFIVMYNHETSNYLEGITGSEYENDGFFINEEPSSTNKWPEALTSRNADTSVMYQIPAFGVSYGKMYQSYFTDIDVSMMNPTVTEQSIKAQFAIACQANEGEQEGNRSDLYIYGQDLYSVYSNNSYTCNVSMMGCAWVQPLMYFVLNNVPMFRGTYLIEKVNHHIEPGNMKTTFMGVRMSNVCTRIARELSIRGRNNQTGEGDDVTSVTNLRESLADIDNNCAYRFYPLSSNGVGGGGIPEDFLQMRWGDLRDKTPNRGVQNGKPMANYLNNDDLTVEQALCASIGAEYRGYVDKDNGMMVKVSAAILCNRYHYCKSINDWTYLIGTQQLGTSNTAATESMCNQVKDIVGPILRSGPGALVGMTVNAQNGYNVEIWNRGKNSGQKAPNSHAITLDDMRRVFNYSTMAGYDKNIARRTGQSDLECKNDNCYWHKADFLFQDYNTVFTSAPSFPEKTFWEPEVKAARNENKRVSDLAVSFVNSLDRTAASSAANFKIGLEASTLGSDYVYITNPNNSSKFGVVLDMILSTYGSYVDLVEWIIPSGGNQNVVPSRFLVHVKENSKLTKVVVVDEEHNPLGKGNVIISNEGNHMHEHFCKALVKKYKSKTDQLKSDTNNQLSNYDNLFSMYSVTDCDTVVNQVTGTSNTSTVTELENENGFIGDWNLGKYIERLHYWQKHVCEALGKTRKGSGSCSRCTGAINRAMKDSGYGMKYWSDEPWTLYNKLKASNSDFVEIKSDNNATNKVEFSLGDVRKGDICVMWKSGLAGNTSIRHTCSFDGSKWYSDFIQLACNVYRSKDNMKLEWHLFRHK